MCVCTCSHCLGVCVCVSYTNVERGESVCVRERGERAEFCQVTKVVQGCFTDSLHSFVIEHTCVCVYECVCVCVCVCV